MDTRVSEHIHISDTGGGPTARIKGSRIRVVDVLLWHERWHWSPKKIVKEFPQLTLKDVYAALAYYWSHHDEIEEWLEDDRKFVAQMRREAPPGPLEEKLRHLPGNTFRHKLRLLPGETFEEKLQHLRMRSGSSWTSICPGHSHGS